MKILTQLAIIFTICLVAECIAAVLPFTFPSGVIGMILLFLLLLFKFIKRRHIEEVSQFDCEILELTKNHLEKVKFNEN